MKSNYKALGKYIQTVDERNSGLEDLPLMGLSIQKKFIPSIANIIGTDMSTYRIIERNQFAYGPVTSRNGDKITIALFDDHDKALISQAYTPFEVKDTNELDPEYLMMWFRRPEFDRYARFKSHGSAREIFDWEEMCNVKLPIPHIDKQREIVKEYNVIQNRIDLNQQLIQKLEETAQAIYKQWFVEGIDLENLPQGWRVGSFEELIKIGSGKSVIRKSEFKNEHYKYPIYGAGGIMGYSDDILLNEKIISIGRVGTHGIVQRINFPCWLSDNTLIIKSPSYEYVYQILLNINYDEINRGGVQGLITQTDINNLQILLPEKSMLEKFEEISSTIFKFQDDLKIENQKLSEPKDLLLSKLAMVEG
jgi:type I restriction enzyme S subunit